jgi:hypothetical protein
MTNRSAFLAERQDCIGGSDAAALFSGLPEVKYACRRRLWYEKSQVPPDYPEQETGPMELGILLEPYFAEKYAKASGRQVSQSAQFRHWQHRELAVHVDRMVQDRDHEGEGVLEVKSFGRAAYYQAKREGMVGDYIIQIQHAMLVTNTRWGSFAAGNRDAGGTPLWWDVARDDQICDAILAEGPAFWKTIGHEDQMPERLSPDDKRCHRCAWRNSCQGSLLALEVAGDTPQCEELRPLLDEYARLDAMYSYKLADGSRGTEIDAQMEAVKEELKAGLGDRQMAMVGAAKIYYRPQAGRVTWDEGLAKAYEKLRQRVISDAVVLRGSLDQNAVLFDDEFPPSHSFKRIGRPFRTLRIYL